MAKKPRQEREQIAERRLLSVLKTNGVANLRTLEQKIADAGPNPLRVQPHILTPVKNALVKDGRLIQLQYDNAQWIHRADEDPVRVAKRIAELHPIWDAFIKARQTGQALEIAVFRAILAAPNIVPFGGFPNLEAHGDDRLYKKEELRTINGKTIGEEALDFIVAADGTYCGIEVKNVRPWLYPHDPEIKDAVRKALTLEIVPVIVARRIPYVTFRILGTCGVVMHETYNQRMANADAALAEKAKDKALLGYHDIRVGNLPDDRLTRFISTNLALIAKAAKTKLNDYADLLWSYVTDEMPYIEFAARVRRRQLGQNEDHDWEDEDDDQGHYNE